ncbi:DNA starvation/stationary phase protection protein (plasmid) [Rhodococcus opacus]|uniref:DNA-binding protein n=1 Tax=Rhodococcus opacus M213 TaxID=1129896 RepID=K8XM66_RHOOP|nr:DNA starvation/stationary phase protection protein [Rhodococcus opacus]EKT79342.1 DNA-binding protein [Rhodococcus opacus M213]ELB87357.1 DNA-binding protein [Rhodococcus wratislaviensis IFP 2016]WKN59920.1 DNA starvation/stationary phase protection protein [Rhodococcus opacus]
MTPTPITTTLDAGQQRIAGKALQGTVVDLIDLSLIAKQAHWNVIGPHFLAVHPALDELATVARKFTDEAAERATAIGVSPDGRAATVAADAGTTGFVEGWTSDGEVVETIAANLAAVIARLRASIESTEKADPVTQDLLIGITARLEQLHWRWQAQSTQPVAQRPRLGQVLVG